MFAVGLVKSTQKIVKRLQGSQKRNTAKKSAKKLCADKLIPLEQRSPYAVSYSSLHWKQHCLRRCSYPATGDANLCLVLKLDLKEFEFSSIMLFSGFPQWGDGAPNSSDS